ncbi:unnamed protein product [Arctia plantaginis]|uniref:Uncharacterized protein n=1 Tax=Arctia plantaginis TaxID=874455 RepID=A0A8S1A0N9_ARCPL|nr:unnamed protein product [Arctia plantaginis]
MSMQFRVFIITSRTSNAKRRAPKEQLEAKKINEVLDHIKPIILGLNGKINITRILTLLKENETKEKHKLTSYNTEDKSTREVKISGKRPEDNKGADRSDDSYEKPMMRNGETAAEADLQYDFDEQDLRIALKK